MAARKDVIIIGAGVIGCSIAYHLAKKGITAQIVEREAIGARASGKAWAVIPYPPAFLLEETVSRAETTDEEAFSFYAMPEDETIANWIELHWSSYYCFADLAHDIRERTGIDIEYAEGHSTFLLTAEELEITPKETVLSVVKGSGVYEFEWLGSDELKKMFPDLNPKFAGGVSIPEFQVEPYKLTLGLAQAAENMGAELKHGDVVGFGTAGDRIASVRLASGTELEADHIILAMGPWSGQGAALLKQEVRLGIFMTECLRVDAPWHPPLQTLSHRHCSIIPKVAGDVILAGRNRITRHEEDDFDNSLSEEARIGTMQDVVEISPGFEQAGIIEHRGDLIACAPSIPYNKPLLGRFPELQNAYVATRFGGLGICLCPAAGRIMADIVAGGHVPGRVRNMMQHLDPAAA
jgi:glycine oxidase